MDAVWSLPEIRFHPLAAWEEHRPVGLVYSQAAWMAVRERLDLPVLWQVEPQRAEVAHWEAILEASRKPGANVEVVYAVGGGLALDAAKYLAAQNNLPLVGIPTALSVDAFLTWASGVRRHGCVTYLPTKPPDLLVVDLQVIANAPVGIRAAGICDVLSIATGVWDWEFAEREGKNPPGMAYLPEVAQTAREILNSAFDCAQAAGRGDPQGLRQLLDCLVLEVQLCNQIGHSRPEEGSEHYFAYAAENLIEMVLPHGNLVGPGILIMAELQGQDSAPLRSALLASGISLDSIPAEKVAQTLHILPDYVHKHQLPFGIAHILRDR